MLFFQTLYVNISSIMFVVRFLKKNNYMFSFFFISRNQYIFLSILKLSDTDIAN
jgi:hypothetical protein